MKIGEIVDELPTNKNIKYEELRKRVKSLPEGHWLTVTAESEEEKNCIRIAMSSKKVGKVRTSGLTMYIAKRQENPCPKKPQS